MKFINIFISLLFFISCTESKKAEMKINIPNYSSNSNATVMVTTTEGTISYEDVYKISFERGWYFTVYDYIYDTAYSVDKDEISGLINIQKEFERGVKEASDNLKNLEKEYKNDYILEYLKKEYSNELAQIDIKKSLYKAVIVDSSK